jgi:hypothetical protein
MQVAVDGADGTQHLDFALSFGCVQRIAHETAPPVALIIFDDPFPSLLVRRP